MVDKATIRQVLGCLIKKPQLLSQVDKYSLSIMDFSNRFERYIFSAITGLYRNNATHIEPIDIENYLAADTVAQQTFAARQGIEYIQDAIEFSSIDNFDYYYNRLKKINLLRDLKKQGFDTSSFYEEDLTKDNAEEINARFETLTTQSICEEIKRKLLGLESSYAKSEEVCSFDLSEGIDEFINQQTETINIGLSIQGAYQTQILGGAELGALTIRSAPSGLCKTRLAIGDACKLAYPICFNSLTNKWEVTGYSEKVLFIITEQTYDQARKMILSYIADVNEGKFKYNTFNSDERERLSIAAQLIKTFNNLVILKMPNPTIELIKVMVREQCLTKDIRYVFYDYIFIGPALINEFKGVTLRNDELLLMFATALKDLAVELNVSIFTSTQVNANADDNKNIRNESSLAGGRSTINKADNGIIISRPTNDELEILQPITSKYGCPNLVMDVFKVRSGMWTQVRIWVQADLGRLKFVDLFVTDSRLEVIPDFINEDYNVQVVNWDDEEANYIASIANKLNGETDGLSGNS